MSRPRPWKQHKTTRTPIDHPEISAGWLSRLFYRWTGLLQDPAPGQSRRSPSPAAEDRRDGRADASALTARQPVRPWPLTAFIWRHYRDELACSPLLQLLGMFRHPDQPWLLNHSMTQFRHRCHHRPQKLLLALACSPPCSPPVYWRSTPRNWPSRCTPIRRSVGRIPCSPR